MSSNNVTLHRVLATTPEKVYRAFTDPGAMAAWLPPYGFFAEVQQIDVRVGGSYKMSFTNFTTNQQQSFGGEYLELQPNTFIKYIDRFDDPNLPSDMVTSVSIKQVSVGTEIKITQENIPEAILAEGCYMGWQDSLEKLKKLVEPVIPDM